ncbi:hypothetical protein WA026_013762 [Henosepilachna vigintioctopunctata]|uniref:Uncharacterized protein n=1 Tax=Henosepilachna vigintioctopunctata TaxID=420089 RepID=A0AAW1V0W5_9CUCU
MISSPDLFDDQNSLISTNTSITESTSNKLRRSWKKLFLEDGTSETLILPDDSSSENNISKGNIRYPYNMNSQIAETIMISSSSDEEDIMKNVLNSSEEKQLDNTEDTSLSYNINNLGSECAVPVDNVSKECCVNNSELNTVGNTSTLDKNVSIPNSDKYEKLLETNINMGNTSNEAYKLDISALSDFGVCGKENNVNVFQPISESYKECSSLNVTEHIEEIFAQTYSPFTSINISDDEATNYHNEQSESCGRISKSNSSADLKLHRKKRTKHSKRTLIINLSANIYVLPHLIYVYPMKTTIQVI